MKIYDAVYTAAVFLQLDTLCDGLLNEELDKSNPSAVLGEEAMRELDLLMRCCNLVLHELAEGDFPLRAQSTLTAKNGKIAYAQLPHKAVDICTVKKDGKNVPFREFYDGITVPFSGACEVTYTFAPPVLTLADSSPYVGSKPSARLVAYGIAREYCLISGMTDDASMWDSRFVACGETQAHTRKERRVRARVWR